MNLQIASRLAIFAVLELAANPERQLSVGEIGEKYGVSSHHLAKVMHVLGRAGLVRSVRGAGGGYQFVGNTRRTTLLDVIQLFENFGTRDDEARPARIPRRERRCARCSARSTISPGRRSARSPSPPCSA